MTTTDLQKPNWEHWRRRGAATIPEAILLSLDIEPSQFGFTSMARLDSYQREALSITLNKHSPGMGQQFIDRLEMAAGAGKWRW